MSMLVTEKLRLGLFYFQLDNNVLLSESFADDNFRL